MATTTTTTTTTQLKGVGPDDPPLGIRELKKVRRGFFVTSLLVMIALGFITMAIAIPKWSSLQSTDKVPDEQRKYLNIGLFQFAYGCMHKECKSSSNRPAEISKEICEPLKINALKAKNHEIDPDHDDECYWNHMDVSHFCLCPQYEGTEIDSVFGKGTTCENIAEDDAYAENNIDYAKELKAYQLAARILTCACAAFTLLMLGTTVAGILGFLYGLPAAILGVIALLCGGFGCWMGVNVGRMYGWADSCGSGDHAKSLRDTILTELDWFSLSPILMTTGLVVLAVAVIASFVLGMMHQGWVTAPHSDPRPDFETSAEFQNKTLN